MAYLSIIGIVLSILLIIFLSLKGVNVLISAPIATILVLLLNGEDIFLNLLGKNQSFMVYLADFMVDFFMIFLLGSIMAKYLERSGGIQSITAAVATKIKENDPFQGMLVVYLVTALLTYGGISLFVVVFAVVPLAKSLFERLNIPWKLVPLPISLGLGTFTAGLLPGSPSIVNVIPTEYLGTTLTAAPLLGLLASIVSIFVSVIFIRYVVGKEITNSNEESSIPFVPDNEMFDHQHTNQPSIITSIFPILLLIMLILVGSALNIQNILILSLVIVIFTEAVIFNAYIPSHIDILNEGATNSILPLMNTAATIAFGQIISNLKAFKPISDGLMNISKNKWIGLTLLTIIFSIITGSASGAVGIVTKAQGIELFGLGYPADLIHRITTAASVVFTNAPHSGVVLTLFTLTKLTHKESFKYLYLGTVLSGLAALMTILVIASVLY